MDIRIKELKGTDKVVTPSGEGLYYRHFVPKYYVLAGLPTTQIVHPCKSRRPHDHEVEDHGNKDAKDWTQVMDYVMALIGKHDQYGVE
jgi:hypothetical protein